MYINRKGLQFSRRDTFDYSTLGDLMVTWLEKFKEHGKYGCPYYYLEKAVGFKEFPDIYTDEDIDAGLELMYGDIDDLIWALDDENAPDSDLTLSYEEWLKMEESYQKERDDKLKLFALLYQMLWR